MRPEPVVAALLLALIFAPPLALGTNVYPVAVVHGNSMFPVLRDGELVVFRHVDPYTMQNGTIIVFVEGDAPVNALNYLVRPTVIHEVIGRVVNQYGHVYYETKGVNNPYPDPTLVPAQNVLGVPVLEVPYAGYILEFFSSPEGLVALVGLLTAWYVESYEREQRRVAEAKMRFLIPLVFLNHEGKLSSKALLWCNFLVEHYTTLENPTARWLRQNILRRWDYRIELCGEHANTHELVVYYGKGVPRLELCVARLEQEPGTTLGNLTQTTQKTQTQNQA